MSPVFFKTCPVTLKGHQAEGVPSQKHNKEGLERQCHILRVNGLEERVRSKDKVILVLMDRAHPERGFLREAQRSHSGIRKKGRWAQRQENENTGVWLHDTKRRH